MNSKLKRLLRAIKKIDMKASDYINKTVLPRYYENGNEPPVDLLGMFYWGDSPQGNEYWMDIYMQIKD